MNGCTKHTYDLEYMCVARFASLEGKERSRARLLLESEFGGGNWDLQFPGTAIPLSGTNEIPNLIEV